MWNGKQRFSFYYQFWSSFCFEIVSSIYTIHSFFELPIIPFCPCKAKNVMCEMALWIGTGKMKESPQNVDDNNNSRIIKKERKQATIHNKYKEKNKQGKRQVQCIRITADEYCFYFHSFFSSGFCFHFCFYHQCFFFVCLLCVCRNSTINVNSITRQEKRRYSMKFQGTVIFIGKITANAICFMDFFFSLFFSFFLCVFSRIWEWFESSHWIISIRSICAYKNVR